MDIEDETLMALADGEIDGERAARLHAMIDADPALAERYALFTRTARLVKDAALADPAAEVSPDLVARIRDIAATPPPGAANVVPLPLRGAVRRWSPVAVAASLALTVGLSVGLLLNPVAPNGSAALLTADLQDRLGRLPSGAEAQLPGGRRLSIVASYTDGAGAFCREYETTAPGASGYVGIACRDGAEWSLRFAMATGGDRDGYAPASSLGALDAFYAATGASETLSLEAERRFLD